MDVNIWLAIDSVISPGVFNSHACLFCDAKALSASVTECNIKAHVMTQLPYALLEG